MALQYLPSPNGSAYAQEQLQLSRCSAVPYTWLSVEMAQKHMPETRDPDDVLQCAAECQPSLKHTSKSPFQSKETTRKDSATESTTTPLQPSKSTTKSLLLLLPGELRNQIYRYTQFDVPSWRSRFTPQICCCLTRMRQTSWMLIKPNTRPCTSFLRVNKQLHREVLSHFYSTHDFVVEDGCYPSVDPLPFLRSLEPVKWSLRSLTVDCRWFPGYWDDAVKSENEKVFGMIAQGTSLETLRVVMRPGAVCKAIKRDNGEDIIEKSDVEALVALFVKLPAMEAMMSVRVTESVRLELPEEIPQWSGCDLLEECGKKEEFLKMVNVELGERMRVTRLE